jgi:hypothetical protein
VRVVRSPGAVLALGLVVGLSFGGAGPAAATPHAATPATATRTTPATATAGAKAAPSPSPSDDADADKPLLAYFAELAKIGIVDPETGSQDTLKHELGAAEQLLQDGDAIDAAVALYSIVYSPR